MTDENLFQAPEVEDEQGHTALGDWDCRLCGATIDRNDKAAVKRVIWYNKCPHCNKRQFVKPARWVVLVVLLVLVPLIALNWLIFGSGMQILGDMPNGIFAINNAVLVIVAMTLGIKHRRAKFIRQGFT